MTTVQALPGDSTRVVALTYQRRYRLIELLSLPPGGPLTASACKAKVKKAYHHWWQWECACGRFGDSESWRSAFYLAYMHVSKSWKSGAVRVADREDACRE